MTELATIKNKKTGRLARIVITTVDDSFTAHDVRLDFELDFTEGRNQELPVWIQPVAVVEKFFGAYAQYFYRAAGCKNIQEYFAKEPAIRKESFSVLPAKGLSIDSPEWYVGEDAFNDYEIVRISVDGI